MSPAKNGGEEYNLSGTAMRYGCQRLLSLAVAQWWFDSTDRTRLRRRASASIDIDH